GVDIRDVARRLAPPTATEPTTLLARSNAGHAFRRAAERVERGVRGPDGSDDWDRIVLARGGPDLASEVLAHGPDVVVESPDSLRDQVVARLSALLAGNRR
ncbi:MAG: WCX domain-containing protein, partial [Nocardioides sp.]